MNVRAKFYVSKVSEFGDNGKRSEITKPVAGKSANGLDVTNYVSTGVPTREITLQAMYDSGIAEEDKSFATATPSGTLTFYLNNPALADEFKPGQAYYLDFTPVPPPTPAQ